MMFCNVVADIHGTTTMAVEILNEWRQAAEHRSDKRQAHMDDSSSSNFGWRAPANGVMKVNVDARWTRQTWYIGYGHGDSRS